MKIEKINAEEFEDLGAWINALTNKVNELVDAHNTTDTTIQCANSTVTEIVANFKHDIYKDVPKIKAR